MARTLLIDIKDLFMLINKMRFWCWIVFYEDGNDKNRLVYTYIKRKLSYRRGGPVKLGGDSITPY